MLRLIGLSIEDAQILLDTLSTDELFEMLPDIDDVGMYYSIKKLKTQYNLVKINRKTKREHITFFGIFPRDVVIKMLMHIYKENLKKGVSKS